MTARSGPSLAFFNVTSYEAVNEDYRQGREKRCGAVPRCGKDGINFLFVIPTSGFSFSY